MKLTNLKNTSSRSELDWFSDQVQRYHRGLVLYIYSICKDLDLAEDMAQEAFITAFSKLSQFNPQYSFSTWIYRIARNLTYQYFKNNKEYSADLDTNLIDESAPPGDLLDRDLQTLYIRKSILSLDIKYREPLVLKYWEGKKYKEIAQILNLNINTTKIRIKRAKDILREELQC